MCKRFSLASSELLTLIDWIIKGNSCKLGWIFLSGITSPLCLNINSEDWEAGFLMSTPFPKDPAASEMVWVAFVFFLDTRGWARGFLSYAVMAPGAAPALRVSSSPTLGFYSVCIPPLSQPLKIFLATAPWMGEMIAFYPSSLFMLQLVFITK